MATVQLDAQELAVTAWFVESAVVSLKEYLEEEGEEADSEEGMESAMRVRDLSLLEEVRAALQGGPGQTEGAALELTPEQLERLGRLADDAAALCRGERPRPEMQEMPLPPDAGALAHTLEGLRDRLRAHPQHPEPDA
ncbi:hypothetical protein AN478_06280 [Thiohalorhabdus denitrificans]|uniref:Uncharacterized protein n=1 Tax=Thiohalorhabdus denitrificans TaxID=381306 RepID=A0A0P9CUQ7_9GAMM|nr:hypothetical protein [Thiohalorhabdus denitrificans]KPV40404.1 hypothetical protein AN478_06280 [Thiohalorhabdus denitrificans]SCY59802.1 hypothetical protein SAMN05661077_2619 [Thiohalorhabdus denitrificans]